jgi:ABC-type transporter Mla maintaining outer membrane lipid asymmetry ATPase subunit MlaF
VALARALAVAPDVLLHDEPTAGLDPASSRVIGTLIQELNARAGITSVVVTHDLELALRLAHRIAILSGGRIVFQGTAGELEAGRSSGAIRHYLEGPLTPDT